MRCPFNAQSSISQVYGANTVYYSQFNMNSVLSNGAKNYGHEGVDVRLGAGTPLYAIADGTVKLADQDPAGAYGVEVRLIFGEGLEAIYAHMSSLSVKTGQVVKEGDFLGLSGNTGNSTGAHLHFSIRKNGVFVDPTLYLPCLKTGLGGDESLPEEPTENEIRLKTAMNLREAPTTSSKVIKTLPAKSVVDFNEVEIANGYVWAKTDSGWVAICGLSNSFLM